MIFRVFLIIILFFFVYSEKIFASVYYTEVSKNTKSQNLFDKGMLNYYAYLYVQAEDYFRQALLYDSSCALCHWGIALTKKQQAIELGLPFAKLGYEDIKRAQLLVSQENEFQVNLLKAAEKSFSLDPKANPKEIQKKYIEALRSLHEKYKNDKHLAIESLALFVDAIAYYGSVQNSEPIGSHCSSLQPTVYIEEAVNLMKPILKDKTIPSHPGILHTFIHMNEKNLSDELNLIAAEKLPSFSGGEIAYYVHMPNHIYWRLGMYDKAIQANFDAIKVDEDYFKSNGVGLNSYYYDYHYLHSHHFLTILGILTGQFELSVKYAQEIKKLMDVSRFSTLVDYRDTFLSLEHLVLVRFEKWNDALNLKKPDQVGELGELFINFSKALAYLNLGKNKEYLTLYNTIKKTNSLKRNIKNVKILIVTYLKVNNLALKKYSLESLEKTFVKNNIQDLEQSFFNSNPPLWLFPYRLFLSDEAMRRGDIISAKKHHQFYQQIYPKSEFGKLFEK